MLGGDDTVKGGRLRVVNEGRYPTEEVERLVRFGLQDLDVKGDTIVAVVQDTKRSNRWPGGYKPYAGMACGFVGGVAVALADRYLPGPRDYHLIFMRLGPPECFPIEPFERNGSTFDYATWQEALVGITAHEGRHVQHFYDGAYRSRSGRRAPATFTAADGRRVPIRRGGKVRVGVERIEPKCEAHELLILGRFRG